jgi:phospholipid/cholesterol/gamma-HCH transport system substrate-binding protein
MDGKALLKVGTFLGVALGLFVGLYLYLGHYQVASYRINVNFKDAMGLVKQSVVRMQGVTIGEVSSIDLNTTQRDANGGFPTPTITLAIQSKYQIPSDSQVRIVSGILITNPIVEITPGKATNAVAQNGTGTLQSIESGGVLAAISPELNQTVKNLNASFGILSKRLENSYTKIDKMLDQANQLLKTGNETMVVAKGMISDPQVKNKLLLTLSNFESTSAEAKVAAKQLRTQFNGILASSSGTLDELKESMLNLFDRLDTTLDDTNAVVKKVTDQVTDPRLQQSLQETVELARTTLARFNQLASDMHQFLGDPQLQGDLKATLTNLKNATAKGEEAVGKVNNLLGKVSDGTASQLLKTKLPKVELLANASQQIDPERFRLDIEARLGFGKKSMANIGLFDLGQDTRLILQGGQYANDNLLFRYGLYASRLGAGVEYSLAPNTQFRADLYDTVRPRLDFRTLFRVNKNASLWLGADSIGRHPSPRIGVQFHY